MKKKLTMSWKTSQVRGDKIWLVIFINVWQLWHKTIVVLNCNAS
jgi:hypothetical protein